MSVVIDLARTSNSVKRQRVEWTLDQ